MMQLTSLQHQLAIQARFRPEVLERVLRVIRHRGFQVCAMNMAQMLDSDSVNIELTVSSQRPINLLSSQLSKLMDVACVEV